MTPTTKPFPEILTQVTCAVILMVTGTEISLSYVEPVNHVITIVWVVGIMNSLNMLDMDAITSTVSISIILSAMVVMIFHRKSEACGFMVLTG